MSVDKTSAQAGETVTVTNLTNSALSWELDGVSQTDMAANGTATFTMPAGNVVVAEHVVETYSITCSNCKAYDSNEGNVITEATAGSTVYVKVMGSFAINSDNNVTLTYYGPSGAASNVYTFTMPAYDAIVGFHDR